MKTIVPLLFLALAAPQETKVENDPRFHPALLTAAKNLESYTKVDDAARFAPAACMEPAPPVRLSASRDGATHGQKLYFLYATDAESYMKDGRVEIKVKADKIPVHEKKAAQQVLIKQSWGRVEVEKAGGKTLAERARFIQKDGKVYTTGEKKDLFIMMKFDEATEGADRGWVYGTVTADLQSVTSSGRVRSCMECHEKAGDGRLFGLPKPDKKH